MPLHQAPVANHYHKNGYPVAYDDATSLMSSELDTTTFFETDNDDQYSSITESTSMSSERYGMHRKKRLKHRIPGHSIDRASSVTNLTESTMSLNIITVTLNMGKCFFFN
jgi:segment polarity protein dishevelled